jgi:hypothetical protein
VIPPVVDETISIALEIFDRRKAKQPIRDIQAVKTFELVLQED